jgi:hypothetical protein
MAEYDAHGPFLQVAMVTGGAMPPAAEVARVSDQARRAFTEH